MSEARLVEARNQLSKTENQCQSEQDKNKKLSGQIQEQVHKTQNLASSIKAKDEQVDLLHVSRLTLCIPDNFAYFFGLLSMFVFLGGRVVYIFQRGPYKPPSRGNLIASRGGSL